jgi:hypothetical protein
MRRALITGGVLAVVCMAIAAATAPAAPSGPAKGGFVKCGGYDLGYTKAKVKAWGMRCEGAKDLFRKWERKVDCGGDGPCERTRVESFVCRFGGTELRLRLRCSHDARERAMKAHWGG